MEGMRGSVFKAVFLNPLVWIGLVLTGFTLHYEGYEGAFNVFFELETYRNLALGAAVYVALFDRRYKPGGGRLDISETLAAVLEAMYVIVLTWGITLFAIVNYHLGGMSYSAGLRLRKSGGFGVNKACFKAVGQLRNRRETLCLLKLEPRFHFFGFCPNRGNEIPKFGRRSA